MNLWKRLTEITGQREPLFIGEVIAINPSIADRCTVQLLPGTDRIEVSSTGKTIEIGQRWMIQGNVITDEAPSTTILEIEV